MLKLTQELDAAIAKALDDARLAEAVELNETSRWLRGVHSGLCQAREILQQAIKQDDSTVVVWQEWWNSVGFKWYVENGLPSAERPPFLREGSEHFGKWVQSPKH